MELYLHSLTCLHGVMLNKLSTRTALACHHTLGNLTTSDTILILKEELFKTSGKVCLFRESVYLTIVSDPSINRYESLEERIK
jgi:hypothetical protein